MSVINDPYDEIVAKIFGSLEYLAYLKAQTFGEKNISECVIKSHSLILYENFVVTKSY